MKLLVVTKGVRYYRYFSPIVSAIYRAVDDLAIALVTPDLENFSQIDTPLPYQLHKMVNSASLSTRLLRRLRPLFAYIYWSFLDVQSEVMLDKMSKKFFLAPLGYLGKFVKPMYIQQVASLLRVLKLNKVMARLGLVLFRFLEAVAPRDKNIVRQINHLAPDIILVTPAIHWRSFEMDYIRAGLKLRIPTIVLIASWDHLTTKGLLSVLPNRILVWNDNQIQEANRYHAVSTEKIEAVGAPVFDQVFEKRLLQPRQEFFESAQLDADRPYVLWAASSRSGASDEKVIVNRFIEEMGRYPALKDFQVLVRPHPKAVDVWEKWDVNNASTWASPGFMDHEKALSGLYNSIAYATAVVGLSTSMFIEAAILDRPCAMLKTSEADNHAPYNKLIHFNYWLNNSYPVATENEADCARWLSHLVQGCDDGRDARRQFVRSFVRPKGIDRPAAKVAADFMISLLK